MAADQLACGIMQSDVIKKYNKIEFFFTIFNVFGTVFVFSITNN